MEVESNQIFQEQLLSLLDKEKTSRQNDQNLETCKILIQIVQLCFDFKELQVLNEQLINLSKKRGQPKKGLIGMVQLAMGFLNSINNIDQKIKLINTLKEVTEKKIFLEVEYARLCLMSVKLMENEDNINEAAKIMQEVQVETYGSMDRREKIEFILYQMKIMIKKQDFVRLFIISKKINQKTLLNQPGLEDLIIIYNCYLIVYYMHEQLFLEASESYQNIFDQLQLSSELETKMQLCDEITQFNFKISKQTSFENYVYLLLISSYSQQKVQTIENLVQKYQRFLELFEHLNKSVQLFQCNELISTDINNYSIQNVEIFRNDYKNSENHKEFLFKQLIQHNLLVIEMYYSQITLQRISELMNTNVNICEEEICRLINQKIIKGRINRVEGMINFIKKQNENQILQNWQNDLNSVLDLIDSTCKLIQRENDLAQVA